MNEVTTYKNMSNQFCVCGIQITSASPFWNNGHCAAGFMDSGISFESKHRQQQLAEQRVMHLATDDPNLHQ
ncbi:hypothetical protein VNO80_26553 [Phaseolus coccineus]|uniref:Uncharacterized protein n=1 Tax=Phaseolus coccineus TaxID=3886 RepID=A0AAN9QKL1_PHACN